VRELADHADQRLDFHRPAALEVLQHRHLVRPERRGTVEPALRIDAKREAEPLADRARLAHHCQQHRTRARVGRDHVDRRAGQRADRIEALVAPELEPDFVADVRADRGVEIRTRQQFMQLLDSRRARAIGLADRKLVAVLVADYARGHDLRRRQYDAADRTRVTEVRALHVAGIDARERQAVIRHARHVEEPVRQAIACGDDHRVGTKQRQHRQDRLRNRMRFERDDHAILNAEVGWRVRASDALDVLVPVDQQPQALRAHGLEVRAARDEAHVGTGTRELEAEVATDRTRAVNAHLHRRSLWHAPTSNARRYRGAFRDLTLIRGTFRRIRPFPSACPSSSAGRRAWAERIAHS